MQERRSGVARRDGAPEPITRILGPLIHAAMRAAAMLEKGDLDGQAAWKRILKAIEELLNWEPPTTDTKMR